MTRQPEVRVDFQGLQVPSDEKYDQGSAVALKSGEAACCFTLLGERSVVITQSFGTHSITRSSLSRLKFLAIVLLRNCRDGSGVLKRAYVMERALRARLPHHSGISQSLTTTHSAPPN